MSLDNYKITQGDIETKGVVAAPDVLSGGAQKNKAIFDRLIREAVAVQFNAMVDALTASSGAGEIGAAVDGIAAGTVLGVMSALKVLHDTMEQTQGATNESVQAALGNRYTKDQTDAMLQGKLDTVTANQMVRSIEFNEETGVFTVTTQGGAVSTIDTMLERVPASFTLENNQLVLTLEDGTRQTADLSAFIDTYTFSSGGTVAFSQNGKTITAEVRDGSLALSKLTPEAQAILASYANRAEAAKESAEAARAGAEVARDAAQRAAATAEEKASAAAGSASAAGNHASNAAGSAGAAKESETNAKASETAAKEAQAAAEQARDEAQAVAGGDFLPLAGGTLTGKLTLDGAPLADLHAATKKYVDDAVPKTIDPDALSSPVPIEKGGTGAASAADALANLGAVAKTGGTMTGSLIVPDINSVQFGRNTTTAYAPSNNSFASTPTGRFLWHNKFAFFGQNHGTYKGESIIDNQVSTDGSTWVASTTDLKPLFSGIESNHLVLVGKGHAARRFTLYAGSIAYSSIEWLEISTSYAYAACSVKVEVSTDNATWYTIHESELRTNETAYYLFTEKGSWNAYGGKQVAYARFTFTKLSQADVANGEAAFIGLKALTRRKGAQGEGIDKEYPYSWDANRNMTAKGYFTAVADPTSAMQVATKRYVDNGLATKAPAYSYGTEDLEAGVTPLETGKLYFVYE